MTPPHTHFHQRAARIADDLRDAIANHTYVAGDRVPTRNELTEHYGVSKVTVQRAIQSLTDEGFLEARGRQGTFVAPSSPHLTRYLFMMPQGEYNQAWIALAAEANKIRGHREFIFHYHDAKPSALQTYHDVLADVESKRIAGIIFAEPPFPFEHTPLVAQPGISRTAIDSRVRYPGIPVVTQDYRSLFKQSLHALHQQGSRRPAVIMVDGLMSFITSGQLPSLLADYDMHCPRQWMQFSSVQAPAHLPNLIRLLFDYPADQQPDALLIANDNFVDPITNELANMGIDDLKIVVQCNFPHPTPAHVPVTRIGFSVPKCLQLLMQNIDLQARGETPPPQQYLRAITEKEYSENTID